MLASWEIWGVSSAHCLEVSFKISYLPAVSSSRNTSLIWRRENLDPAFYWNQRKTPGRGGGWGGEKGRGSRDWGSRRSAFITHPLCPRRHSADTRSPRVSASAVPASPVSRRPGLARAAAENQQGKATGACAGSRAASDSGPPPPINPQGYGLGLDHRRRFLPGSSERCSALTAGEKDRDAGWFLGGKPVL